MDTPPKQQMSGTKMKNDELVKRITDNIASYDIRNHGPYPQSPSGFRRAAVLLPLAIHDGEIYILLTKRSKNLRTHPAAVSFPGGARDDTDSSDIDTALRESQEEIGLSPDHVKILGILTRGVTFPNTVVYPVVGLIPFSFQPVPNPNEVEFAFNVPLSDFLKDEKMKLKPFSIKGRQYQSRSLEFDCEYGRVTVWGFTASFCMLLAHIVYNVNAKSIPMLDKSAVSESNNLYAGFEEYFNFMVSSRQQESKL